MDTKTKISLQTIDNLSAETIGQDVLRYIMLPQFLGKEKNTLLYFLGRNLARNIEFVNVSDIIYLFDKLRWGKLEVIKETRKKVIFHLMSDDVAQRLDAPIEPDFRIEAGFLAEAFQLLYGRPCECTESINNRLYRVEFKLFFTD